MNTRANSPSVGRLRKRRSGFDCPDIAARRRATQTAQGKAMRNAGGESMKTAWLTADEAVLSVR
jgi:hypothetical protein